MQPAGIPLIDAVVAASHTPSQTLALAGIGGLQADNLADVVVIEDDLFLRAVLRHGEWLTTEVQPEART